MIQIRGGGIESLFQKKQIDCSQIVRTLTKNLSPFINDNVTKELLEGNLENFLICLSISSYMQEKFFISRDFEKLSLKAIAASLNCSQTIADIKLLLDEMPKILMMSYPSVEVIRKLCLDIIPKIMLIFRYNNMWNEFYEIKYQLEMLKTFDVYKKFYRLKSSDVKNSSK